MRKTFALWHCIGPMFRVAMQASLMHCTNAIWWTPRFCACLCTVQMWQTIQNCLKILHALIGSAHTTHGCHNGTMCTCIVHLAWVLMQSICMNAFWHECNCYAPKTSVKCTMHLLWLPINVHKCFEQFWIICHTISACPCVWKFQFAQNSGNAVHWKMLALWLQAWAQCIGSQCQCFSSLHKSISWDLVFTHGKFKFCVCTAVLHGNACTTLLEQWVQSCSHFAFDLCTQVKALQKAPVPTMCTAPSCTVQCALASESHVTPRSASLCYHEFCAFLTECEYKMRVDSRIVFHWMKLTNSPIHSLSVRGFGRARHSLQSTSTPFCYVDCWPTRTDVNRGVEATELQFPSTSSTAVVSGSSQSMLPRLSSGTFAVPFCSCTTRDGSFRARDPWQRSSRSFLPGEI